MKFEMNSIINSYKSYLNISLSPQEIEVIKAGGAALAIVGFLEGATIQVQISGGSAQYPESWPKPNITNQGNIE